MGPGTPLSVTVEVEARKVTVTGKRGTLVREFKHLSIDVVHAKEERKIRVDMYGRDDAQRWETMLADQPSSLMLPTWPIMHDTTPRPHDDVQAKHPPGR